MRYWLSSVVIILFTVASGNSQDKKDVGKDPKTEPKEPTEILGKSFEQWRKEIHSPDPARRETAMKTILLFGPIKAYDAVPDLITELKKHSFAKPVDLSVRVNGIMALSTVFRYKKDPDAQHTKEAVAIYRTALKDSQVLVKLRAVQGIVYLGMPAREALDDVIALANDPVTWEVRKEAIPVMIMMSSDGKSPPDKKVLPVLKKRSSFAVGDEPSYLVRIVAVQGLGLIGKDAVLVELNRALSDPSKDVRVAAVQALAMGPKEKSLLSLRKALADPDQSKEVRLATVPALAMAGQENALKDMREVVSVADKEMRLLGIQAIVSLKDHIKPNDLTTKKLNERFLAEKDPIVHIWTSAAIMGIAGKCDKTHMAPILDRLADKEPVVRLQAFQAIQACGIEAPTFAAPTLLKIVEDKDLDMAIAAIDTLGIIGAFEAESRFRAIMKDSKANQELKEAAENALDTFELIKAKQKKKDKTPDKK